ARETSNRIILRDPTAIEHHGPLLFHLMAADARDGDGISVRERGRQVSAWLQRRNEILNEQRMEHPHGWDIDDRDIAAQTEAILRIAGSQYAVGRVRLWRPKSIALRVATILSCKLITTGEASLVERCLTEAPITTPWDLFLLIPLALAGRDVDVARLEAGLVRLLRRGLIRLDQLKDAWSDGNTSAEYFDMILTACEVIIARAGDRACTVPILERFADRELRRRDRLYTSRVVSIGLDHGVGHFRPLSLTRQRRLLAYH